ncbi:hypothetical protein FRX31_007472, partial [Thalictrum thalictroides]
MLSKLDVADNRALGLFSGNICQQFSDLCSLPQYLQMDLDLSPLPAVIAVD